MRIVFALLLLPAFIQQQDSDPGPKVEGVAASITYQCAPCGCADDEKTLSEPGTCPACGMVLRPSYPGLERRRLTRKTVAILLFDGADIMDVTGPWSVFEHSGLSVVTVAKQAEPVRVGRTLEITAEFTLETLPDVDVLVIPGGGAAEMNQDPDIVAWIAQRHESTGTLFSVCSGAFFLAKAGLLNGRKATTFAGLIPDLARQFPEVEVSNTAKYVDSGKIVTSAGLSSGIDASFHVVSKLYGQGRAQDIANHMEYAWDPESTYARSKLADRYLSDIRSLAGLFTREFVYSRGDENRWEYRFVLTEQLPARKVFLLIQSEMAKMESWTKQKGDRNEVRGQIADASMGNAQVTMKLETKETGSVVTLVAERRNKTGAQNGTGGS